MTPETEIAALDAFIDRLNLDSASDGVDSEIADLAAIVLEIRRLAGPVWPDEDFAVKASARIAASLQNRANGRRRIEPGDEKPGLNEQIQPRLDPLRLDASPRVHRRHVREAAQMAAAILALVLVAGLLAVVFQNQSAHHKGAIGASGTAESSSPVTVPDVLLATQFGPGTISLWGYQPGSAAFQPLLDGAGQPVISPDGRQLVAARVARDGNTVHVDVVALSSATLGRLWQTEVASFPASALEQGNLTSAFASIVVTADRVYAVPSVWDSPGPLTLVALDRASGREVGHWSIEVAGQHTSAGAQIYVSSDGATIFLIDSTMDPTTKQTTPAVYLRLRASDGHVENQQILIGSGNQPIYPSGRPGPDGHTLYSVATPGPGKSGLAIQFFDLVSGTLQPALDLPFQSTDQILDHEEATSPDGRTLYVLAPTSGELAVVDLQSRSVTQVVPVGGLTAGGSSLLARIVGQLRGLVVQQAAAKFYLSGDMQLSLDGKTLYAVGVSGGSGYEAVPTGVVAIDTTTWHVIKRWMLDAQVSFLQLAGDGYTLYVQTYESNGKANLTALDTRTGVASPVSDNVPGSVVSLPQLYRETYGKLPGSGSAAAVPSVPVARLDVSLDRTSILTGDRVTVDARFVDPNSGKPVSPGRSGVHYEPPAQITATFYTGQSGPDDVVVNLEPVGYGHYRGSVSLTTPTVWSLRVDATRSDAPGSRAEIASAVAVQAAFAGNDGRRYMFELTTDPARPLVGRQATIRLAFVDAERGTPLPDGAELVGGLPETIDAAFFRGSGNLGQASEMVSATLRPTGHGSYTGTLTFDTIGGWAAQISFTQGGRATSTLAATVQVGTP